MGSEKTVQIFAYTPGLKIKRSVEVIKTRKLPIKGDVLVELGDIVSSDDTIARAYISGDPIMIDAASTLQVQPFELDIYMLKKAGDKLKEGDIVGRFKAFFGLINRVIESPVDGTLESVSEITGQIVIRQNQVPIEVNSYIPGEIIEILPKEGAVIKTRGVYIQGIFGLGSQAHGPIKMIDEFVSSDAVENMLSDDLKDKILVIFNHIDLKSLKKAISVGVSGLIVGGIKDEVLMEFLGEELGVAITGEEDVGITLIVTEGFGEIPMSQRTYNILKEFEGYPASINGTTQIRAGVIRPEIIVSHNLKANEEKVNLHSGMLIGTRVRIIREPYFGKICEITGFPVEPKKIETGSLVRVLTVKLDDVTEVTIPRANVEILEE